MILLSEKHRGTPRWCDAGPDRYTTTTPVFVQTVFTIKDDSGANQI